MPRRISIRRARRADLKSILEIENASFASEAWERELFEDALRCCADMFLVAVSGRRTAGYVIACVERGAGEVISIAVHPRLRTRGVGRALMTVVFSRLARLGIGSCRLMVRTTNRAAIRFYAGLGFKRTRRVRDYYGHRSDAWRMVRCVTPTHQRSRAPQTASGKRC